MDYARKHTTLKASSKAIQSICDAIGYYGKARNLIITKTEAYRWGDVSSQIQKHDAPVCDLNMIRASAEAIMNYREIIIKIRRELKQKSEPMNCIQRASETSRLWAQSTVSILFPSATFEVTCDSSSQARHERRQMWPYAEVVNVPITWSRIVYNNDISSVMAGDGPRFIMDAKERKIDRLNSDNIRAFSCLALKRKNRTSTIENMWVLKYHNDGGEPITATHANFARAESLLNRRIKDQTLKALGI